MKSEQAVRERLAELRDKRGLREAEDHGRIQALEWVLDDE